MSDKIRPILPSASVVKAEYITDYNIKEAPTDFEYNIKTTLTRTVTMEDWNKLYGDLKKARAETTSNHEYILRLIDIFYIYETEVIPYLEALLTPDRDDLDVVIDKLNKVIADVAAVKLETSQNTFDINGLKTDVNVLQDETLVLRTRLNEIDIEQDLQNTHISNIQNELRIQAEEIVKINDVNYNQAQNLIALRIDVNERIPKRIEEYPVKMNLQDSDVFLIKESTGDFKRVTLRDLIIQQGSIPNKGIYTSEVNLQSIYPNGVNHGFPAATTAIIDDNGTDLYVMLWDSTDLKWVRQGGGNEYDDAELKADIIKNEIKIDEHIQDRVRHITAIERDYWNRHIVNDDVHVTLDDKTRWDNNLNVTSIIDDLISTDIDKALSANQGRILDETKIDKVDITTSLTDNSTTKVASAYNTALLELNKVGYNDLTNINLINEVAEAHANLFNPFSYYEIGDYNSINDDGSLVLYSSAPNGTVRIVFVDENLMQVGNSSDIARAAVLIPANAYAAYLYAGGTNPKYAKYKVADFNCKAGDLIYISTNIREVNATNIVVEEIMFCRYSDISYKPYLPHGGNSASSVEIVDNLTSTATDKAASANMVRELDEIKANKSIYKTITISSLSFTSGRLNVADPIFEDGTLIEVCSSSANTQYELAKINLEVLSFSTGVIELYTNERNFTGTFKIIFKVTKYNGNMAVINSLPSMGMSPSALNALYGYTDLSFFVKDIVKTKFNITQCYRHGRLFTVRLASTVQLEVGQFTLTDVLIESTYSQSYTQSVIVDKETGATLGGAVLNTGYNSTCSLIVNIEKPGKPLMTFMLGSRPG